MGPKVTLLKLRQYAYRLNHRRIQELKLGGKAESSRRRQGRLSVGRGCLTPHRRKDLGREQCPFSRKFFRDFEVKMAYFRGLLVLNFVFYDQNSIEIHIDYKDCYGD